MSTSGRRASDVRPGVFWPEQLRQLPLTEKGKEQESEGNSVGLGLDT